MVKFVLSSIHFAMSYFCTTFVKEINKHRKTNSMTVKIKTSELVEMVEESVKRQLNEGGVEDVKQKGL